MKFLDKYIIQAQTGDLVTKEYNEFWDEFDLNVKISFGMGAASKIPWISFLAPGMSTSKGFYPVYLYYKQENVLILSFGISETYSYQGRGEAAEFPVNWSYELTNDYPKISDIIEKPPRYGNSYCYKKYNPKIIDNKVIYLDENQEEIKEEAISNDLNNIIEIYNNELNLAFDSSSRATQTISVFSVETHLEDFIVENWENTILSKKYELIIDDGNVVSQQYHAPGVEGENHIDILAKDKKNGNYVVIELKNDKKTIDAAVGQTLRYMGWVKKYKKDENVKGVIIARNYDEKLKLALSMVENVEAMTYEIDFKLNEYK